MLFLFFWEEHHIHSSHKGFQEFLPSILNLLMQINRVAGKGKKLTSNQKYCFNMQYFRHPVVLLLLSYIINITTTYDIYSSTVICLLVLLRLP